MDVRMPVMDGREATRIIVQQFPEVKVLVLSTFDEGERKKVWEREIGLATNLR